MKEPHECTLCGADKNILYAIWERGGVGDLMCNKCYKKMTGEKPE